MEKVFVAVDKPCRKLGNYGQSITIPPDHLNGFLRRFPSFLHCLFGKVQTIAKENGTNTYIIAFYTFNDVYSVELKSFTLHIATVDFVWCCKMAAYSLCFEWKVKRFIPGFQGGISLTSFLRNTKINCCEVLLSAKKKVAKI